MGTRLESVDDLRRAMDPRHVPPLEPPGAAPHAPPRGGIQHGFSPPQGGPNATHSAPPPLPPPAPAPASSPPRKPVDEDTALPFRPSRRPPAALLTLLDDDGESGEIFRLRDSRYVVGRTQGQINIPHDTAVSSTHLEIVRVVAGGRSRWQVKDLGSTNGTYARVSAAPLGDGQEFLVGGKRLRFDAPSGAATGAVPEQRAVTQAWAAVTPHVIAAAQASLTVLTPTGEGDKIIVQAGENWIGSDVAGCKIAWTDDPLLSKRHAKLIGEPNGEWRIEVGRCRNGVWLRVKEIMVDGTGEFLIGEQRLTLRVVK